MDHYHIKIGLDNYHNPQ